MITQPVLCTREEVIAALDFATPWRIAQADRAVIGAAGAVHGLCKRKFYPTDATRYFDWPNYQFTYPWKIYLDENELAGPATQVITGTNQPTPTVIPISAVNFEPVNYGPPYSWIELRRDQSVSFGANTTPQRDTAITGPFGYWLETDTAGQLAAPITTTSQAQIQVTDGSMLTGLCVGDIALTGAERLIISDKLPLDTADTVSGSGCTTLSFTDNQLTPSGGTFLPGEVLLVDSEQMLVEYVLGSVVVVKRGWAATALATHVTGSKIYAYRLCNVTRGDLGTAAATHTSGTALAKYRIPALARQLAVAEALNTLQQETAGYARKVPSTDTLYEAGAGPRGVRGKDWSADGLSDLRLRCYTELGRKARQRTM
jgi:hypothetical protein